MNDVCNEQCKALARSANMVVSTTTFQDPGLQLLYLWFWISALSLVIIWMLLVVWTLTKFQDLENQRRALIVVYQIMHMHIDRQPAVDKRGHPLPPSTLFFRLCDIDPDYQQMLQEVMFEDTADKKGIAASLLTSCATSVIIQHIPVMLMIY